MAVLIWVVLNKTTFGYELKAVGLNKNAARYAGINEKKNIILSMAIAGALAGFGAGLFYLSNVSQWNPLNSTSLPGMGFNGISVALLASSNPIGTVFSALFISHISVGGSFLSTKFYPTEISDLISGIIIYLCAFSMLFRGKIQSLLFRNAEKTNVNAEPAAPAKSATEKEKRPKRRASNMLLLIKYTLLYGIVLMLVALGGMFSEHSGIINIALEGIMVIGGVAGVLTLTMLPESLSPFLVVLISILVAALAGVIYSLLLAFASINLKADQTIGGTALNLLATAIAVVISKYFSESGSAKLNYSNKPFLFSIGGLELSVFVPLGLILLVVSYIVLYKTRFGLRLRACGEHPQAADSVGINVYKMRYAGVILSGALGAVGGLAYIVPPVQTWNFEVGVAGAGFLALAVMIFGQWKPFHIFGAAMFFAVFKSLANIADSTFLAQLHWSSNIYNMMPFVASMVILAFTSKNSMAPKAEGIPYDKGSR